MASTWQDTAAKKRAEVLDAIPTEWRIVNIPTEAEQKDVTEYIRTFLNPEELEITETDAEGIVLKTSTGQWSAESVTQAFCHRAALAHQLVNCLHEVLFGPAITAARALDAHYARTGKPLGPLHGLPISLKDQFHVAGAETSMGYVSWLNTFEGRPDTDGKARVFESELVRELRALGAVIYVKTSVPPALMAGETLNAIVGYTQNPKNRALTAGGSSGGEGALVGLRGSPLGFGSDIGGSVRIPAAFNGIFGLRPSTGRLPYEGVANSMDGQNSMLSVIGPLAGTVGGLKLAVQTVLGTKPWLYDPMMLEMPWRKEMEDEVLGSKKLVFGVLKSDGQIRPTPPVCRAVDEAVGALKRLGHEVIEWSPSISHGDLAGLAYTVFQYDGGLEITSTLAASGEPLVQQLFAYQNSPTPQLNASDVAAHNVKIRKAKKQYMDYWNSTATQTSTGRPVDAIITPVAPWPAPVREGYSYYAYSMWVNTLDYTSVVVPITNVDKEKDGRDLAYTPLNEKDKEIWESYDPDTYAGAHVSVQLVGRRLQEEKMLAIADVLVKGLSV